MNKGKTHILNQFAEPYRSHLENISFDKLEEIRFRIDRPVILNYQYETVFLGKGGIVRSPDKAYCVTAHDIKAISAGLCNHSVYAHLDDLKDGFITICGGHRVGIAGRSVIKNGQICGLTSVSGLNIRIAKEYVGCSEILKSHIAQAGQIKNTLLISPPQCGKTTYLRDLCRIFSEKYKITIVDERSEIAGSYGGVPQFNIGMQTDVLDRFPKKDGMILAVRSLSPEILVTDEIGEEQDVEALNKVSCSGCRLFASVHGENFAQLAENKPDMLSFFDLAVILGRKNNVPSVLSIKNLRDKIC